MGAAGEVVDTFNALGEEEKKQAAAAIAQARAIPDPPSGYVGPLWVMVVAAFIALLLGGAVLMFVLVQDDKSTEVIGPLVTGALGVLAGLLAPSPVAKGQGGSGSP